jgi:predicted Zn-dependent protease
MIGLSFLTAVNIIDARKSSAMANPKIEQFKKILQLDPKDETLWFGLGKAYMSDKNWAEAIPALEQCIQVRPSYSAAYFALAQSLEQEKNFVKCRSICAEGITVATTNGDLLVIKNLEELNNSLPS